MGYKTITETCYFKTGRDGVVFEATDMLQPNLFDNNKHIDNSIFSRSSKFRFTLVDARKGKGRAIYYNLDPNEILLLSYLLSDGNGPAFTKRVGAFSNLSSQEQIALRGIVGSFPSFDLARFDRMLDYTSGKVGTVISFQKNILDFNSKVRDRLIVKKLSVSYEEAMRSASKWKIVIEEGEAFKDSSKGNGLNIVKYGTYKSIDKVQLLLQKEEITIPINEGVARVIESRGQFYALMKAREVEFTRRKFKERDFEGERIDEWNPEGKPLFVFAPVKKVEVPVEKQMEKPKPTNSNLKCSDCGVGIAQNVHNYSVKAYERALCYNCQNALKLSRSN